VFGALEAQKRWQQSTNAKRAKIRAQQAARGNR
jgi:hypothetical protein